MNYNVIIPEKIERKIKKLDKVNQNRVISKLSDLEENPELGKPLHHTRLWSLRIGKYRIIYEINQTRREIYVESFRHRKEGYGSIYL